MSEATASLNTLPTFLALPMVSSSRITSSTAWAAAMHTGLPPKVLKYGMDPANGSSTSCRAAISEVGRPLAIGLPEVTRSGTMPWRPKPQKASPVRVKPGCTSSAIHTPPSSCTVSMTGFR